MPLQKLAECRRFVGREAGDYALFEQRPEMRPEFQRINCAAVKPRQELCQLSTHALKQKPSSLFAKQRTTLSGVVAAQFGAPEG